MHLHLVWLFFFYVCWVPCHKKYQVTPFLQQSSWPKVDICRVVQDLQTLFLSFSVHWHHFLPVSYLAMWMCRCFHWECLPFLSPHARGQDEVVPFPEPSPQPPHERPVRCAPVPPAESMHVLGPTFWCKGNWVSAQTLRAYWNQQNMKAVPTHNHKLCLHHSHRFPCKQFAKLSFRQNSIVAQFETTSIFQENNFTIFYNLDES